MRRLSAELAEHLAGARIQDAGSLDDGRPALLAWRRGSSLLLCIDAFGSPPVVTLESGELSIGGETGFTRALARALRGTLLRAVEQRHGDRLLRFTFGMRSRFGIDDEIDLWVELVPKFGNAVLVRNGRIVRALKEFSLAQNPRRAVRAGLCYAAPPLASDRPALPRLIAQSGADPQSALRFLESDDALRGPLYVYRHNGALVQAHLLPLPQIGDADVTREASLLDLLLENRRAPDARTNDADHRVAAAARRLTRRSRAIERSLEQIRAQRTQVEERERLRLEGDRIFATLHERDASQREEAKERARALFERYRKLGISAKHLDARERALQAEREAVESLSWELERASGEELPEVETGIAALEHRVAQPAPGRARERRKPLEYRTPAGSRVLVGRSPIENAELTFKVARPSDLWFHARGTPGAHVILSRDDRAAPSSEDVAFAASLAAGHSKASESGKVVVDFTERKFVKKRRDAPPGMVTYTRARSIVVEPRSLENARSSRDRLKRR